jgi:hypothetical protein
MNDPINHPSHYVNPNGHECADCLSAWGLESDALLWQVGKYIARAGKKGNKLEDLKKAEFYLKRRIKQLEPQSMPVVSLPLPSFYKDSEPRHEESD